MSAPKANSSGFRMGLKQVFLPNHVLTLCRSMRPQPPNFAKFRVPLSFNKLDMRDYLKNVYNVQTTAVRSHILQQRPRRDEYTMRIKRPPPVKYMTVEMTQAFVFPADLTEKDKHAWHNEQTRMQMEGEKDYLDRRDKFEQKGEIRSVARAKMTGERKTLREQARDLLEGKAKWTNKRTLDPKWTEGKAV